MKSASFARFPHAAMVLALVGYVSAASAHTAGAVLDPVGNNASATDMAVVYCYDDGSGAPYSLVTQISDETRSNPEVFVNTQIFVKSIDPFTGLDNSQLINATDPVPGDGLYGPEISVVGYDKPYYISVSKTAAGANQFSIVYHCMTANHIHTGTDINVLQVQ